MPPQCPSPVVELVLAATPRPSASEDETADHTSDCILVDR